MTIGTPKKDLFNKSFLGEAFQDESQRWLDIGLIDLACYAPDPYKLCFQNKYKWTCKVIQPTSWIRQPLVNKGKFSDNDFTEDLFECKLNGRSCLRLDTDLGDEMRPLESKDVFIDVKVGDFEVKKKKGTYPNFFFSIFISVCQFITIHCSMGSFQSNGPNQKLQKADFGFTFACKIN